MSWTPEEIEAIQLGRGIQQYLLRFETDSIDAINESGRYAVTRAVASVRIRDCLVDVDKLDAFRAAIAETTVASSVDLDIIYVDIEDLSPPAPSVALEMVMDSQGVFSAFVTQDSVEEFLLFSGEGDKNAHTQAVMFMKALTMHYLDKHEHDETYFVKKPTTFCDCPIKKCQAWRDRTYSVWEQATIDPESLIKLTELDDKTIKSLLDYKSNIGDSVLFGPKRLALLRSIAAQISQDLDIA